MQVILRDYFHLTSGAVLLLDHPSRALRIRSLFGPSTMQRVRVIPTGKGIIDSAARLKRPLHVPNVGKKPRYIESALNTQSEPAIPLIVRDEAVSVLDCQSDQQQMVSLLRR